MAHLRNIFQLKFPLRSDPALAGLAAQCQNGSQFGTKLN